MAGDDNCLSLAMSIAVMGHGRRPIDHLAQPLSTVFWVDHFLRMRLATFTEADFDVPRFRGGLTVQWRWTTSLAAFDRLLDEIIESNRLAIVRAAEWPFPSAWRRHDGVMPIGQHAAIMRSRDPDGYVVEDPLLQRKATGRVSRSAVAEAASTGVAVLDYRFGPPPPPRADLRDLLETSVDSMVRPIQPGRTAAPFGLAAIDHLRALFDHRHLALYDSTHFRTMVRYYLPRSVMSFVVGNRDWFARYVWHVQVLEQPVRDELAKAARASARAWENTARHMARVLTTEGGGAALDNALVDLRRAEDFLVDEVRQALATL